MGDDLGRAQRRQVEELQGRARQARIDLDAAETEGFTEELQQLTREAHTAEKNAALIERDASATFDRLAALRRDVDEAERQLLIPKTVSSTSPAVLLLTIGFCGAALWLMLEGATSPDLGNQWWFQAGAVACALTPPPILAWLWRRQLSGGRTFRSPS